MSEPRRFDGVYQLSDLYDHLVEHGRFVEQQGDGDSFGGELTKKWIDQYAASIYEDEAEREYKSERFMAIYDYIAKRMSAFDTDDYAVYGSDSVGALVSKRLLRAIHELFTSTEEGHQPGFDPSPSQVMELADTY